MSNTLKCYKRGYIIEDIERIQGEQPFRCASVKQVVNERKQGSSINFSKNKKEKKGYDKQEKRVVHTNHGTPKGEQETEQHEHSKTHARENQYGNIIDMEA